MGEQYKIAFTEEELMKFEKNQSSFGVSIENMKKYLNAENPKERDLLQRGIPIDSTNCQLANWILCARNVNPSIEACIKGDNDAQYPVVKKVLDILQDKNMNRFNLITNLENVKVKENAQ